MMYSVLLCLHFAFWVVMRQVPVGADVGVEVRQAWDDGLGKSFGRVYKEMGWFLSD